MITQDFNCVADDSLHIPDSRTGGFGRYFQHGLTVEAGEHMFRNLRKCTETGFTLVELLIVVVILATLAAIAVPQFSSTTDDAKQAAFESNLASLRAVAELYRQQHGVYPGAVAAAAAVCINGANQVAADGTAAFPIQLTLYTDYDNSACTGFDAGRFRFGPYLKEGIPANPLGRNNDVTVVKTGVLGLLSAGTGGWRFDAITGELIGDH